MALTTTEFHRTILGTEPTAEQLRLYNSYPQYRGVTDRTQDSKMAEAAVLLALRSGTVADRVLIFAPQAEEDRLLKQCETMALTCFEGCGKYPRRAKELIEKYKRLFDKLKMTGRLLQIEEEPEHWVSFGFTAEDALPAWVMNRLLPSTQE